MIANEREYRVTKQAIARFEAALDGIADYHPDRPLLQDGMQRAIVEQLAELREQIAAYERLRAGQVRQWRATSISELIEAVISARTASGLPQKTLAAALELKPQQIQRYEATRYTGVSADRIQEVIDALGLQLECRLALPAQALTPPTSDTLSTLVNELVQAIASITEQIRQAVPAATVTVQLQHAVPVTSEAGQPRAPSAAAPTSAAVRETSAPAPRQPAAASAPADQSLVLAA